MSKDSGHLSGHQIEDADLTFVGSAEQGLSGRVEAPRLESDSVELVSGDDANAAVVGHVPDLDGVEDAADKVVRVGQPNEVVETCGGQNQSCFSSRISKV